MPYNKRWTDEDVDLLRTMYSRNNISQLVIDLNRSEKSIRDKAANLGVKSIDRRLYTLDEEIFDVPNPINSYFAGFIAADGCVRLRKNSLHKSLSFNLSIKDKSLLEDLLSFMKSDSPIKCSDTMIHLEIKSNRVVTALESNFNIIPRKTFDLVLPNIPYNLLLYYLIGYIDGDGTISTHGRLSIAVQKKYGEELHKILAENGLKFNLNLHRKVYKLGDVLSLNTVDTKTLVLLHELSTHVPSLSRKWSRIKFNKKLTIDECLSCAV